MRKKKLLSLVLIPVLTGSLAIMTGCNNEASAVVSEIDALGDITIESQEALDSANADYEALSDEQKKQVDNYSVLEDANNRMSQILYAEIKDDLSQIASLKGNYFAKHYDMKGINAAVKTAEKAVKNSAKDDYQQVYEELESEINEYEQYVESETAKSYSAQTNKGKHPFAVKKSDIPKVEDWSYQPITLQSSKQPEWLSGNREATDRPANVTIFIDGSGYWYAVKIKQIPTRKIDVQSPSGDIETAYVNTLVAFKHLYDGDGDISKNEQPAYLLANEDGYIQLALHSYDGKKYYVLYE